MPSRYTLGTPEYDTMKNTQDKCNFPIDIVYLWVDGNDPEWKAKKNRYTGTAEDTTALEEARFRENDELKYSLRSIEKYAPWVNRIFIVTDGQTPSWLDTTNPKVQIIDHSQIFPADALPIFNSQAIESVIHKIPGLSEHFICGNDDTMLAAPASPSDFFSADGRPIVRLHGTPLKRKKAVNSSVYRKLIVQMRELIAEKYGMLITNPPHHNLDSYRISDIKQCEAEFSDRWKATAYSRFRSDKDIQRCVVGYYAIATGRGIMRKVGRFNRINSVWGAIKAIATNRYANDSRTFPIALKDYDAVMRKYNPLMFCMNDGEMSTDEDCRRMSAFLQKMFPERSSFEKQ
jgi:hypothetical protein